MMYYPVAMADKTDNVKIYTFLSLEKWGFCVQSSIFIRAIDYKGRIKGCQNALKSKIDGTIYCVSYHSKNTTCSIIYYIYVCRL